jgi:hypothetical protein
MLGGLAMMQGRAWIAAALVLGLVASYGAATAAADDKEVSLKVWTIRATKKNSDVSPELRGLADKLKRQFKYTGFKLEKQSSGTAKTDKTYSTKLIGAYEIKITPKRHDDKEVQLQVELFKAENEKKTRLLKATVTLRVGEFQLFGGPKLDDSDALIVAVSGR